MSIIFFTSENFCEDEKHFEGTESGTSIQLKIVPKKPIFAMIF